MKLAFQKELVKSKHLEVLQLQILEVVHLQMTSRKQMVKQKSQKGCEMLLNWFQNKKLWLGSKN